MYTRNFLALLILLITSGYSLSHSRPESGQDSPVKTPSLAAREFDLSQAGEVQVSVSASAPGCSWKTPGKESAVVSLRVDGQPNQEIVLYGGQEKHTYDTLVGPLTAGKHHLELVYRPDLSPQQSSQPRILDIKTRTRAANERERLIWAHTPLLYGRDDVASSDVPLVLFYQWQEDAEYRTITYSIIWSNEDGGTGNDVGTLVARWGRTTDIEWVYEVKISRKTGEVVSARYQGANHQTGAFHGTFRGKHPMLHTVSRNNMVGETGPERYLFALPPLREYFPDRETREAVMDTFSWTHGVAADEMLREGKWESTADPKTAKSSDMRHYLQVDYQADVANPAFLAVRVRLKNGQEFFSDHGRNFDAVGRSGWIRTTVELPPDTPQSALADIAFVRRDTATSSAAVRAVRAFLLDKSYRPMRPWRVWQGTQNVVPGTTTALPE